MVLTSVLLLCGWASDRTTFKAIGHNTLGGFSSQMLGAMPQPPANRTRNTRLITRAAIIRVTRRILKKRHERLWIRTPQQSHRLRSSRAVKRWLSLLHGRGPPLI